MLSTLPEVQCEVWIDGSVGSPQNIDDRRPRRVAVGWDDGYYAGTIEYLEDGQNCHLTSSMFQRAHGRLPYIIARYDDGDLIAYEVNYNWVRDGDHHTFSMYMLDISSVGFSAYAI